MAHLNQSHFLVLKSYPMKKKRKTGLGMIPKRRYVRRWTLIKIKNKVKKSLKRRNQISLTKRNQ